MNYLVVAIGGAIGAVSRYALSGFVQNRCVGTFPWGTLVVNVLGCLLIGALAPLLLEKVRPEYRLLILVGGLGALTTWSSFGYETITMLSAGQFKPAFAYVAVTNLACLSSVWLSYRVVQRIVL